MHYLREGDEPYLPINIQTKCVVIPYTGTSLLVPFVFFLSDDDNRIVLKPIGDLSDCQRDYINASYIDVSII